MLACSCSNALRPRSGRVWHPRHLLGLICAAAILGGCGSDPEGGRGPDPADDEFSPRDGSAMPGDGSVGDEGDHDADGDAGDRGDAREDGGADLLPVPGECDVTVPSSQEEVGAGIEPGSTVCLEAGTRDVLKLYDVEGTEEDPIVFVNDGGVVTIDASGEWVGLRIENSRHFRVTGTGVESHCGAGIPEDEQRCGIRVTGAEDGVGAKVESEHFTIDHVEVFDITDTGVSTRDKELGRGEWIQHDVAFRHMYVHDIADEGHYHGSSSYQSGEEHLLDGVEVTDNFVARTGRDGIQVGSTPWNCTISGNEVYETGLNGESSHMFGIIVNRGASCDIVDNHVEDSPRSGIYDQGLHGQTIAGNTVKRSGEHGITVREGNQSPDNPETPDYPRSTRIVDNSVDGTGDDGIKLGNDAGEDNRIIGNMLRNIEGEPISLSSGVEATVEDNDSE